MKQIIFLLLSLSFPLFLYAQDSSLILCNSSLSIHIDGKSRYELLSSKTALRDQSTSPQYCTYHIMTMRSKPTSIGILQFPDGSDPYKAQIDSCYRDTTINGSSIKFYRYQLHTIKQRVALIDVKGYAFRILFEVKNEAAVIDFLKRSRFTVP